MHKSGSMDWITDTIAIGNYLDAENLELRLSNNILSMICLNGKLRGVSARDLQLDALEVYDLKDGPGNNPEIFCRAVRSVGHLSRKHPRLLVQCHAGRSRSVIVVAGHLMIAHGWTSAEALSYVGARREMALTAGLEAILASPVFRAMKK